MEKKVVLIILLSMVVLLLSKTGSNIPRNEQNTYLSISDTNEAFTIVSHKDLVMRISADGKSEILYENPDRINLFNTNRNTLLRLDFTGNLRSVFIANEENFFYQQDLEFINDSTAEISVPEGMYGVFTVFYSSDEDLFKLVTKPDIDLSSGETVEISVNESEAEFSLEHNYYDVNNEPFEINDRYSSYYGFECYNTNLNLSFWAPNMYTSNISDAAILITGEHSYDENSIYITQHGPYSEVNSNIVFSNVPSDYTQQQIFLDIPENIEDPKIATSPGNWFNSPGRYFFYIHYNNIFDSGESPYRVDLYMMNNEYSNSGITTRFYIGEFVGEDFQFFYSTAPFHCIDEKIGSFMNSNPIETDYLSPDNERLTLGESLRYIYTYLSYNYDGLYISLNFIGYEGEEKYYDYSHSSYMIMDSFGNIISEGELNDLTLSELLPDEYTLIIENSNFMFYGLHGNAKLVNNFNTDPELSRPPRIEAFQIRNEDNIPMTNLEHNENGTLLFLLTDTGYIDNEYTYFPVVTDSVKVFYKEHFNELWNEIEVEMINEHEEPTWAFGKVFSANLSELTLIDSSAYDLKIYTEDTDGNYTEFSLEPAFVVGSFDASSSIEESLNLSNHYNFTNYPNPFNPSTMISFDVPTQSKVNVSIYNIKGQLVKTLINKTLQQGNHLAVWNGTDEFDTAVSSGVYLYKLKVKNKTEVIKKCVLMK
jgi:hypothetical protein